MADEASTCSNSLSDVFPSPNEYSDKKYRFFTLPIDQVPGYDDGKPQILVHRPNSGLQWFTLDQCLPVVTCLKLESTELVAERRSIIVFKDFEVEDCPIETTNCETELPAPSN